METLHVLLVEDNEAEAALLRARLAQAVGFSADVERAGTLDAAVRAIDARRPAVVLYDLGLPDARGLDGFRRLSDAAKGIPVVILTNVSDPEVAVEAVRVGAQDFVPKGDADTKTLERTIRFAIERQGLRAQLEDLSGRMKRLAVFEDRERIGRDMHDHVIQALFAVGLTLQSAAAMVAGNKPAEERIAGAIAELDRVIRELRNYIFTLQS